MPKGVPGKLPAKCHPDKPMHGQELCRSCYMLEYNQEYYEKNKERRAAYAREYRRVHPEKGPAASRKYRASRLNISEDYKRWSLKTLYGLGLADYRAMLAAQENKCAICGTLFDSSNPACVDHCHEANKNRSLLCKGCNVGIGHFKENINLLEAAIAYLKRWRD
jgi:hypothetical protein